MKSGTEFDAGRLRELREAAALSIRELGRRAAVRDTYLGSLERGEKIDPGFSLVCRLADALAVKADDFRS